MRKLLVLVLALLTLTAGTAAAKRETTPPPATGPMILNWAPGFFKGDQAIVELQIYRDPGLADSSAPFYVISNPPAIAQGYVDLTPVYAADAAWWMPPGPPGRTVEYSQISLDGLSMVPKSHTWNPEGYGTPHTYQICAILAKQMGRKTAYSYNLSQFGTSGVMTCIEKITADPQHIVMPQSGEPILVSDLRSGDMNLRWMTAAGANQYQVTAKPVDPTIGGEWHSSIIYHMAGSGDEVSIDDSERVALAAWLNAPVFVDKDIMWRVDARNSADTEAYWTPGDWCVFRINATPSGPP